MLGDSLAKMDTIYVEKANDFISQNEMLQQIGIMHTMYDDNFNNLLIVLSILGGIIGIFIPLIILFFQNYQYNKFDKKIRKELKTEIKKEFEMDYKILIKKLNKYTDNKVKINEVLKLTDKLLKGKRYNIAFDRTLYAISISLESLLFEELERLHFNLYLIEINIKEITNSEIESLKNKYYKDIINKLKLIKLDDKKELEIINQIKSLLNNIFKVVISINENIEIPESEKNNSDKDESSQQDTEIPPKESD